MVEGLHILEFTCRIIQVQSNIIRWKPDIIE